MLYYSFVAWLGASHAPLVPARRFPLHFVVPLPRPHRYYDVYLHRCYLYRQHQRHLQLPTFNHLDPSSTFDDPRSAWDPDALIASTRKPFFVELKEHWRLVEYDEAEGQYDHDDNFMLPNPDDWSWRVIGVSTMHLARRRDTLLTYHHCCRVFIQNGVEVHTSDRSTSPPSPSSTLPISTLRSSTAFYHTFNPSVIQSTPMRDIDDKKAQAQARDKRRAGATPSPPKGTKPSEDKPQDLERRSEKRTKRLIPEVVLTGKVSYASFTRRPWFISY